MFQVLRVLAVCAGLAQAASAQTGPTVLTAGEPIQRNLSGGEIQLFQIDLNSGQYLRVVVEQKGIDVSVALIDPDQKQLLEMDSPNGNFGPEPISAVAPRSGTFTIQVQSPDAKATPGQFEIRLDAVREPTVADRTRADAEQYFREGSDGLIKAATRKAAADKLEALLPVFQSLEDHPMEVSTLNQLGIAYNQSGQARLALERFNRALTLSRTDGDHRGEARELNNIGGAHDILGEPQQALLHYRQALDLWDTLGNDIARGDTLNNIGVIYYNLGELQLALDFYQRALPLRRIGSDRRREADTLDNIALAYAVLGDPQTSLDELQQSLNYRRAMKDVQGEGNSLNLIGFTYASTGDTTKALEYFSQALPLRRTAGDRRGEAVTLKNIGIAYSTLSRPQDAIGQLDQALSLTRAIHSRREEANDLVYLGQAYLLAGDAAKAADYYSQSLAIFATLNDQLGQARAHQGLAETDSSLGKLAQARTEIETATGIIEAVRGHVTSQQLRTSFFGSKQDAYEFQIDLLMRMHLAEPAKGYDTAALEASERARARSLLELLAESGVDVHQGVDPTLLAREREISQSLNSKSTRLIGFLGQPDRQAQAEALKQEIGRLETDYQEVRGQIRESSPHYASITQPQPLGLAAIQRSLDPDTLLLEYSLGIDRGYVWAVTENSIHAYPLPGRNAIDQLARRLYQLVTTRSTGNSAESAAQKQARIDQSDRDTVEQASKLSAAVLGPVAGELKNKRLAIVADGALQYIPFSMLPVPSNDLPRPKSSERTAGALAGYHPLVLNHEIVSLPSASALVLQRQELTGRKPAPKNIALLADPVFDSSDPRVSSGAKVSLEAPVPEGNDVTRTLEHLSDGAAGTNLARIRRLPYTRQEADRILAAAPKSANFRALDFDANVATVLSGRLAQYRYVHFATHGYIDSEKPGLSALVLSLVNERGEPEEGLLATKDIYNLKLPADLVVLSACQTGLGKEIKGEGIVGLTRGFMYAGAARIIVSMWNVSDRGTADLMARLYQGIINGGMRPTAALRAAQIALLDQPRWRSPYYWAAFVQQGEWR